MASNIGAFSCSYLNYSFFFYNKFIQNFASSITPYQRDKGINPMTPNNRCFYITYLRGLVDNTTMIFQYNSFFENHVITRGKIF